MFRWHCTSLRLSICCIFDANNVIASNRSMHSAHRDCNNIFGPSLQPDCLFEYILERCSLYEMGFPFK